MPNAYRSQPTASARDLALKNHAWVVESCGITRLFVMAIKLVLLGQYGQEAVF
jgi:hypothetical protein